MLVLSCASSNLKTSKCNFILYRRILSLPHKEYKIVSTDNPEASAADDSLTLRKTVFFVMWPGLKRSAVSSFIRPEFIDK